MSRQIRFTLEADEDLQRLYDFLLMREDGIWQAEQSLEAIAKGLDYAASSPWGCRRADGPEPSFRELIVSWGSA
ncbi:MAG: type II toxin-antitoxin system RelE/ParE family toxin, partial [Enterobacteriaceae bacterium]